ncbi:hypothetical protein NW832_06645, partial [Synechococcus sp. R5-16]|uniref:hypothetical protein n=2 Tax=unclassified Synechococcus TaxID=2626047 RepID=UPI0039C400CA
DQVVQLGGVPAVLLFGGVENLVASIRKALQSAVNFLTQLLWDYQLATYRDNLAHGLIVVHPDFDQQTYMEEGFPLDTKPAAMVRVSSPKIW